MIEPDLRDLILSEPERVLDDRDVMNALVAANERALGSNIVDLRGIAMQRLETRLDRLEDTHRSVIAAAYENLAGTNQIHRAVLQLLEPLTFPEFIAALSGGVAQTLRLDPNALRQLGEVVQTGPVGHVANYLTNGRNLAPRPVMLRPVTALAATVYGTAEVRSEAVMRLDLGEGRLPAMLVFGSEDPAMFRSTHGTDLLAFFAGVFERLMRRWLA